MIYLKLLKLYRLLHNKFGSFASVKALKTHDRPSVAESFSYSLSTVL